MKRLVIFILMVATPAYAGFFGPNTYDECVEKYVMPQANNQAAIFMRGTCIREFKNNEKNEDYLECIRDGVDGVKTDTAAFSAYAKCKNKFEKK